ncbi:aldo/keto reductase [Paenibacillus apii]|uniref:aldo/keto reductase n=1 Tax=Paenibacillus apii TaxID=1850370 RepID=UPI002E2BB349|nr:aldo/keto reductase [Paenibacillus apii]
MSRFLQYDTVISGKIRYIGCSNMQGWEIMKSRGISELRGLAAFKSSQSYYSLTAREIEREIIPVLKDQNMGLIVWSHAEGDVYANAEAGFTCLKRFPNRINPAPVRAEPAITKIEAAPLV